MVENSKNELANLARKLLAGMKFRFSSFFAVRVIQMARIVIFARLFSPADIGIANLALSCVAIMSLLANLGFAQNLIRRKFESSTFTNTAFTLSLILGFTVFALTLISAPLLSKVFSVYLDPYIRFLAVMTLAVPLRFPIFLWEKELQFGHPSAVLVIGEGVSFLTAVGFEFFYHMGIWSLIIGSASGFMASGLYIWIFATYRPKIQIMCEHVKPILNFGVPLMIQGINSEAMSRGDNLMIGAYAGTTQLAFYNFAWQLPVIISSLTQTIDSMLFPVYAKINHDKFAIRRLFNITNKMWSITGSFIGFAMLIFAEQIVSIVYGPKWEPVIPILRVMLLSFIIRYCTGYAYDNLALVRGRTKYMMKWGIVNTILIFSVGQFMIMKMGAIGGAWFWTAQAVILIPAVRLPLIYQELKTFEFISHIWQPLLSGIASGFICYLIIEMLPIHKWGKNLFAALSYIFAYILILLLLDKQLRSDTNRLKEIILRHEQ